MRDDDISIAADAFFRAFETFIDAILEAEKRRLCADDGLDLAADRMVEAAISAKEIGVEWLMTDTDEIRNLLRQRKESRKRRRLAEAS